MHFEQKKIQIETLSEYLTVARKDLGLSLEEVARKTGIKPVFIEALEAGSFGKLPAQVYVLGFLRELGALYSVGPEVLLVQFKKEQQIQQQLQKKRQALGKPGYRKYLDKVIITPRLISLAVGLLFVGLTLFYIVWQVWSINKIPGLRIVEPQDQAVAAGSYVMVKGQTGAGNSVTINGQNVFVDPQGNFQTQLGLSPGPKEIEVVAKNRFGKSFSRTLQINSSAPAAAADDRSLELKIDFTAAATLEFSIDGQPAQSLVFNPGDSKTFMAKQKILISTSNAGATRVTLNGQNLGAMGRAGESLNSVPFTASPKATSTEQ